MATAQVPATTSYAYDARDQLTSDGASSYAYTANGDLSSVAGPSGTVASTSDAYGQQATQGTQGDTYDALGRDVQLTGQAAPPRACPTRATAASAMSPTGAATTPGRPTAP